MLRYLERLGTEYVSTRTEEVNAAILDKVFQIHTTVRFFGSKVSSQSRLGSGVGLNADPTRIRIQAPSRQTYSPL
jgi:hypothetical protein